MQTQTQPKARSRKSVTEKKEPQPARPESPIRADIRTRMAQLEAANDGVLTPEAVVADARDPKSPLHGEFEWDVKKAAYSHWIERARVLIRRVRYYIREERQTIHVPLYVRDPNQESEDQGYVSARTIVKERTQSRIFLIQELERIVGLMTRTRLYAVEAHDVEVAVLLESQISAIRDVIGE